MSAAFRYQCNGLGVVLGNAATGLIAHASLKLRLAVPFRCVVESLLEIARDLGRWIRSFGESASRLSRAPRTKDQNYPQGNDVDCHHPTPKYVLLRHTVLRLGFWVK